MPEVTVSMPAYNSDRFIRQAIDSVLSQHSIDLELLIVDDASTDHTLRVIESVDDQRLKVIRNERRMGIGYCHNVVVRESSSPHIAHVDADDFILPGALRKTVDILLSDPKVGQSHCYFFDVDEHGETSPEAFYRRWHRFRRHRPPWIDYKSHLARGNNVINHLRTYPKQVIESLGGFNEELRFGVDYEMAIRVLDRYKVRVVPEFLYCRRVHTTNTTESMRFKVFRFWAQGYRIRRRLAHESKVRFLKGSQFDLHLFVARLAQDFRYHTLLRIRTTYSRTLSFARWRLVGRVCARLYRQSSTYFAWWPLGFSDGSKPPSDVRSIAYYTYAFPVLTETFIQREVDSLTRLGVNIKVFAHKHSGSSNFDATARRLMQATCYLDMAKPAAAEHSFSNFASNAPLRVLNTFLYLLFRRHTASKSFQSDCELFRRTLRLAYVLGANGCTHVHSPWATDDALVALLAARLLKISYSVQARAYDLHRNTSQSGLAERLRHADFIVTNCHFNDAVIRSLIPRERHARIFVVYEGLVLDGFRSARPRGHSEPVTQILSVARMIPAKGLEYLMEAIRLLKNRGYALRCDIVGGLEPNEANYYLQIRRMRRSLSLEGEVGFLGSVSFDRVLSMYRAADIFVLPSVVAEDDSGDVTPNSLIEAMAAALPVISTQSRGIPELVEDGSTGILVQPRDAEALSQAMARLIDDPVLRDRLARGARRRAEEKFDIDRNMTDLASLFMQGELSAGAGRENRNPVATGR